MKNQKGFYEEISKTNSPHCLSLPSLYILLEVAQVKLMRPNLKLFLEDLLFFFAHHVVGCSSYIKCQTLTLCKLEQKYTLEPNYSPFPDNKGKLGKFIINLKRVGLQNVQSEQVSKENKE